MEQPNFEDLEKEIQRVETTLKRLDNDILNLRIAKAKLTQSTPMQAVVKPDACGQWQKTKPDKPCLMVVKKCGLDNPEYDLFELKYIEDYLAVICSDGEEWGDYDSLTALEYYVIEHYNESKHSI